MRNVGDTNETLKHIHARTEVLNDARSPVCPLDDRRETSRTRLIATDGGYPRAMGKSARYPARSSSIDCTLRTWLGFKAAASSSRSRWTRAADACHAFGGASGPSYW